jgi:septal ring factor EnvC (AmiA/AmiB activator)
MRRTRRTSLLPLVVLIAAAGHPVRPTGDDATRRALQQAEASRAAEQVARQAAAARAAAAAAQTQRLTAERIAAAARLREAEAATAEAAARMDALAARRRQAEASLAAHAETMQPLLPLIERLSLFPAETLLAVPARAEDTLRGVLVLRGLARELGQEAVALRQEQAALAAASQAERAEAPRLAAAEARQQVEAAALDQQIAAAEAGRREAEGEAAAASRRVASEAARAETLRGVLTELEAQRRLEQAQPHQDADRTGRRNHGDAAALRQQAVAGAAQPHGTLTAPVAGTVVHAWGDATEAGPATGISYQAPPAARVVALCSGRVVFAAPFRSYGLLLIVDCGGGYHTVLAGFERLDVRAGQSVAAGEPVGAMPNWEPGAAGSRPALYLELRRDGEPVNPAPWLRAKG